MYGDPHAIRRLAHDLRLTAVDLRAEGRALRGCLDDAAWTGRAAEALAALSRGRLTDLVHTATLHDDAAEALDRHAHEVEHLEDLIEGAERRFLRLLDGARGLAGRLVAPASGHRDWLSFELPWHDR